MKLALLQLCLAALLVGLWLAGVLAPIFANDRTFITWAIAALFVVGLLRAFMGHWGDADRIGGWLILLGLLGTVIGLSIAVGGAEGRDYTLRDLGASSALNTTICGIVGSLWLDICRRLVGDEA